MQATMDDISIISIPDSDISTHTLIDADTPPAQGDDSTPNQQFYACSLFINHWNSADGTCKGNEDLRSAKKSYVNGLKEKPTETPTIVFAKHNYKDEMISISSRSTWRCRSPIKSRKSDESRKRKSSDWPIDLDKRKRDENHNNLVGTKERRKTVVNTQTATIERRKTIFIENPMLLTKKSDRKNTLASVQNSSETRNIRTNLPSSPTSSSGSAKFGGHRLATTSSNHTVTSATAHDENRVKTKDYTSQLASNFDWKRSPHREVQLTSSSHRPASSKNHTASLSNRTASSSHRAESTSHRHVSSSHRHASSSHRPESSSQRQSSSPSSNTREHKTKNILSSKKMRFSGDKAKSKQFSDSTKKHDAAPLNSPHPENVLRETQKMDGITADMLNSSIKIAAVKSLVREIDMFGKDHDATNDASSRENILKNYKIPKTGCSSKPKSNDENVSPTKSSHQIKTLPSLSKSQPVTTSKTHKRPKSEKPSTESDESQTHRKEYKQKKKSSKTTTSGQKTSDTNKLCQSNCDQAAVPELDDCTVPKAMNPKVVLTPLKFNPLHKNATGKKEVIASGNDIYVVRHKKNKIKITKCKTEMHRNPEQEYLSTRETIATEKVVIKEVATEKVTIEEVTNEEVPIEEVATEEIATEEVATDEITTEEVPIEEVATEEIAAEEVAIDEITTEEVATDEIATEEVATDEIATEEIATEEVATEEIAIQIDSSQQTISVSTSNFGVQKNDDETDALLKKREDSIAMFTLSVKNYEKYIKENEKTISSQVETIHVQQQMIVQIIKEREIKMREYEDKIKMQEHKMHLMNLEIEMYRNSNFSMAEMLKDTSKSKPKSRRPTTSRLSTSRPPNVSITSNMNGLPNDIRRISPSQPQPTPIRVKHIDQLTGNSPPLFQNSSTLPQSIYSSSATITTQLLTNPANGVTGADSGPNSGSVLAQILMNQPNTVSNAIPTSIDNSCQTTQYSTHHTNAYNNAFLNSNGNNGQTKSHFSTHHTNALSNAIPTTIDYTGQITSQSSAQHTNVHNSAFLNLNGNNGQTTSQFPTHHTNALSNAIPTTINYTGQITSQSSTQHTNVHNNANAFMNSNGNNGQTTSQFPTHHTNALSNAIPTTIDYTGQITSQSFAQHTNVHNSAFLNLNGNNCQTTSQFPTHHTNALSLAIPTTIDYAGQITSQSSTQHTNVHNNAFLNLNGNNGQTTSQSSTQHTNVHNNAFLNLNGNNGQTTSQSSTQHTIVHNNAFLNLNGNNGQTTSQSSTHRTNPIPHQMLARQPERTKSTATRPSTSITINPLQNTQMRNRSLTFYDPQRRNLQQRQRTVSQEAQAQNTLPVYQPTCDQQPVFYCLGCYKTATLVCRTCRNYCSCSKFCYDLIAAKHKNECILPNMVSISNL